MLALTICTLVVKAPVNLPDLWTLLICIYSFVHFIFFLFLFNLIQLTLKNDDLFFQENQIFITDRQLFNFECILSKKKYFDKKNN